MIATATKPRKLSSPRYPGWTIEHVAAGEYLMTRDAGIYAIRVTRSDEHGWEGMLLTWQWRDGPQGWKPAQTPFRHCVPGVVREAERRAAWMDKQRKTNWY